MPEQEISDVDASFRVLGISFVVDQRGKGPRMLFKYPLMGKDDLFNTLSGRQIAKLFRPKPALCGQPMTLSVGGTVFCCCAVLMDDPDHDEETAQQNDSLVLFSVIVALAPHVRTTSIPIGGWLDSTVQRQNDDLQTKLNHTLSPGKASASFRCIRQVHVSLARLCRVLEREERRCSYITEQSNQLDRIRQEFAERDKMHEIEKGATPHKNILPPAPSTSLSPNPSALTSPISLVSTKSNVTKRQHRRGGSFSLSFDREPPPKTITEKEATQAASDEKARLQEQEQEILEIAMSQKPENSSTIHQGNLVLELCQAYHALARNDDNFVSYFTRMSDFGGGDSNIIFINRHVTVSIEPVASTQSTRSQTMIRPYHTLLFPNTLPSQLALSQCIRPLQQLLRAINPQTSLNDVALDTNLPIGTVLDMSMYLVARGVCNKSSVISRNIRLACCGVRKIRSATLDFSQEFGVSINLFHLSSFLTEDIRTLGQTMYELLHSSDSAAVSLRTSFEERGPNSLATAESGSDYLEDLLYQMVVWLCSHKVLVQMEDYIVPRWTRPPTPTHNRSSDEPASLRHERKTDAMGRLDQLPDDALLGELWSMNCLTGSVSILACSWKTGIDPAKLRALVARQEDQLRIVTRTPAAADDWATDN